MVSDLEKLFGLLARRRKSGAAGERCWRGGAWAPLQRHPEVGMIGIASLVAAKSQAPKEADSGEAKVGEKQRDARKLG